MKSEYLSNYFFTQFHNKSLKRYFKRNGKLKNERVIFDIEKNKDLNSIPESAKNEEKSENNLNSDKSERKTRTKIIILK
jgi:hypothetical protein